MKTVKAGTHIVDDKGHLIGTTKREMSLDNPVYLSDLTPAPSGRRGVATTALALALRLAWERMRKN